MKLDVRLTCLKVKLNCFISECNKVCILCRRVDWSYAEDNFLLLAKVGAMILDPCPKKFANIYAVVREVLHSLIPVCSLSY